MRVTYNGQCKIEENTEESITQAIEFYARDLLTGDQYDSVKIQVNFFDGLLKNNNVYAQTGPTTKQWFENQTMANFAINIDSGLSRNVLLKTLAHETVHVHQFMSGRLRPIDDSSYIWCGKSYHHNADANREPYEIDANGREVYLFQDFMRLLKKSKNALTKN